MLSGSTVPWLHKVLWRLHARRSLRAHSHRPAHRLLLQAKQTEQTLSQLVSQALQASAQQVRTVA